MNRRKSMSSITKTNKNIAPIPLVKKPSLTPTPVPAVGPGGRPDAESTRTACIRTFGCQMNVHDSDRMRRMILDAGYTEVTRYEDADLVVLNTCYVRENAVDRVRGHLGELSRLKREGRVKKVALTGCIGAAEESRQLEKQYSIDLILGTHNTYELAEFIGLPGMEETHTPELPGTEGEHTAFVTIMTGCNYKCSYCVVPSVRGRMVCRPMENVVHEVRRLVGSGTQYVTLLGQTVDAWRDPEGSGNKFFDLLGRVAEEAPRVWFTTSHPSNMEDRTLRLIGERETIVGKLHLPVQSGSDRMLKAMHRGYKSDRYRRKIGSTEEIYIRHARNGNGRAVGETWSGHAVHVPTPAEPGGYVTSKIESAGPHVLYAGEPVGPPR